MPSSVTLSGSLFTACVAEGITPQGGALSVYNARLSVLAGTAFRGCRVDVNAATPTPGVLPLFPFGAGKGGAVLAYQSAVVLSDAEVRLPRPRRMRRFPFLRRCLAQAPLVTFLCTRVQSPNCTTDLRRRLSVR